MHWKFLKIFNQLCVTLSVDAQDTYVTEIEVNQRMKTKEKLL